MMLAFNYIKVLYSFRRKGKSELGASRHRLISIGTDSESVNIAIYACASSKGGGGKVINVPF